MNKKITNMIAVSLWLLLTNISIPQESWGQAELVWNYPNVWFPAANPAFYDSDFICFENIVNTQYTHELYIKPIYEWLDPIPLPSGSINSQDFNTISPFITYNSQRLYFSSDRPGGYGGFDIWVSESDNGYWQAPENLGPNINTELNEYGPSLPLDESTIYFTRTSRTWDGQPFIHGILCVADKEDGEWSVPEVMPDYINVNERAWEPCVTSDGNKLYFSAYRPNDADYHFAYVTYKTGNSWSIPEALNDNINRLQWCPWDSVYWCAVPSISVDSSGTAAIFTYLPPFECPVTYIKLSHLTVGIQSKSQLPEKLDFNSYPNPFNARTRFEFALPEPSPVEICIYDIMGRLAERIDCGYLESGRHSVAWDASQMASGIYFANMAAGTYNSINRLVLLK